MMKEKKLQPYGNLAEDGNVYKKPFWKKWQFAAAVLAVAAVGAVLLQPRKKQTLTAGAIAKADYPKAAPYPDETEYYKADGTFEEERFSKAYDAWWADVRARRGLNGYREGLEPFLTKSAQAFLTGKEGENKVYSPLNAYLALGMLAEATNGNSRQQILELLGSKDIDALRMQADYLWKANYCDDGAVTSILAGSLWLAQDLDYRKPAVDALAKHYHASSYQGKMGSDAFNKLFQSWLDEQTGGLLKEQVSGQKLKEQTVLALAATIYFRAKWSSEFAEGMTEDSVFHAQAGDLDCAYMRKEQCSGTYYWGDQFCAASQSLNESGCMWFLLPDQGVSAQELLQDPQAITFLMSQDRGQWEDQKQMLINFSIPKFDVSSKIDMKEGLKNLGITDVLQPETADFSTLATDADGAYLDQADHAARVAIDEHGVTAAAYTVMAACGTAMPVGEEIDFVLDRPFLFAVTGDDGLPLFVGVVEQPAML